MGTQYLNKNIHRKKENEKQTKSRRKKKERNRRFPRKQNPIKKPNQRLKIQNKYDQY